MSKKSNDELIFNIIEWNDIDDNHDDDNDPYNKKYIIKIFGRTEKGESVYLKVLDFDPHFYILLPDEWNDDILDTKINKLIYKLKKLRSISMKYFLQFKIISKKKLYGFYGDTRFKFIRLTFNNKKHMMEIARLFKDKIFVDKLIKFEVYESNIEPFIRFIHRTDIQTCGWISISKDKLSKTTELTTCNISYQTNWSNIKSVNNNSIAPFYICSFDIECTSGDGTFPQPHRLEDKIIQIGLTFTNYGNNNIIKKIMISLNTCDNIDDVVIYECKDEIELLLKFQEVICSENPDIITGYNIFSFDQTYIMERAKFLKVPDIFYHLSKLKDYKCNLITKNLSSSALGDNKLNYIDCIGRVNIDLMKVVQRDYKLNSYKLDSVAEYFFKNKITNIEQNDSNYKIYSDSINILKKNNYIRFEKNNDIIMKKYKIIDINYDDKYFIIDNLDDNLKDNSLKLFWGMVKDDIKPNQIFEYYNKDSYSRKIIAEYCIQDCALVSNLINKLEIITNNISMASVCHVPLSYIFFRGQGIKSLSLIAKFCLKNNYLIPVMEYSDKLKDNQDNSFEGATVFEPVIGFHKKPIVVLDYNSLYPSSIISKNISHETLVTDSKYDDLPDYIYYDVYYDNNDTKICCRYAKKKDEYLDNEPSKSNYGIIPTILMGLLTERKLTKNLMKKETDTFKKNILDGKQLALKITANSIYGQLGAPVSPVYFKQGAACTTSIGRDMLNIAKNFIENDFIKILLELYYNINDDNKYEQLLQKYLKDRNSTFEIFLKEYLIKLFDNYTVKPNVIYGDTDSIFINMDLKNKLDNLDVYDTISLDYSIKLGQCASKFLKTLLQYPHNMEYEKTFYPFALMAKKKYIGNKYEDDIDNFKFSYMGVVLVRRDNANIVKKIIGNMVNIMMNEINIDKTISYIKEAIHDMLNGKFLINDFITSKSLKGIYKGEKLTTDESGIQGDKGSWKWDDVICSQAHVCLAQRIKKRDPGNSPQLNERIPFVTIEVPFVKGKKVLQGCKIEHPDYIIKKNLNIDYLFYLTNQIMNPAIQFLELIMNHNEAYKLFDDFVNQEKNNRITRDSYSKKREIDKKKFIKKYLPTNDTNIISQFDDFIDYNCLPIIHNIDKIKKSSNNLPI
jgi:DNA polymerase elongation subunit (family B)